MKKVIVITGPTASGKSGIGIELAKKLNGTVISADSMQIYKKLDVGTAKVTEAEAVNEFLEIWRNPNTTDVKITYNVIDEKTQQREEKYKAWKKSGAKSTCPVWIRDILK